MWTRLPYLGERKCATSCCTRSARWRLEAGDVASDYCSECKELIYVDELERAVAAVLKFDWSDNDADAVAAIDRLRRAIDGYR